MSSSSGIYDILVSVECAREYIYIYDKYAEQVRDNKNTYVHFFLVHALRVDRMAFHVTGAGGGLCLQLTVRLLQRVRRRGVVDAKSVLHGMQIVH